MQGARQVRAHPKDAAALRSSASEGGRLIGFHPSRYPKLPVIPKAKCRCTVKYRQCLANDQRPLRHRSVCAGIPIRPPPPPISPPPSPLPFRLLALPNPSSQLCVCVDETLTVLAYRVTRCLFQWAVVALAGTKIKSPGSVDSGNDADKHLRRCLLRWACCCLRNLNLVASISLQSAGRRREAVVGTFLITTSLPIHSIKTCLNNDFGFLVWSELSF